MKVWFLMTMLLSLSSGEIKSYGAEPVPQELRDVGIEEKLGNQLNLSLKFRDETGVLVPLHSVINGRQPVVLALMYYRCPNLCHYFINGVLESFRKFSWSAGQEFQFLAVSIDPRETSDLAEKKRQNFLSAYYQPPRVEKYKPNENDKHWHFWVNDVKHNNMTDGNARRLADEVGFRYKYDKEQDQFAHTSALVILTPEGRVSRYLYGIQFDPKNLRLALVEAGGNKIGTIVDRLLLYCYHYDPKTRQYTVFFSNLMKVGAALTVLLLSVVLFRFWRVEHQRV